MRTFIILWTSRHYWSKLEAGDALTLSQEEQEQRITLYKQGLNDKEISEQLGLRRLAIWNWRKKHNLSPNAQQGGKTGDRLSRKEIEYRLSLIKQGLTDHEIARRLNMSVGAFNTWRNKRNIPPNAIQGGRKLSEEETKKRMELYSKGLYDSEIAKKTGITGCGIQMWRERNGLSIKHKKEFDFTPTWKLGYLVGLTCGDGNIVNYGKKKTIWRLSFSSPFKKYMNLIEKIINNLFPDIATTRGKHIQGYSNLFGYEYYNKIFYRLEVSSKDIYNYLHQFKKKNDQWIVPSNDFPKPFQYGFIGGIIDAEGSTQKYFIAITNKYKSNLEQLKQLLLQLDFKYGKIGLNETWKRGSCYYVLLINGVKNLRLVLEKCKVPYKKEKLIRKNKNTKSLYEYTKEDYENVIKLREEENLFPSKISSITSIPKGTIGNWIYNGAKPLSVTLSDRYEKT